MTKKEEEATVARCKKDAHIHTHTKHNEEGGVVG